MVGVPVAGCNVVCTTFRTRAQEASADATGGARESGLLERAAEVFLGGRPVPGNWTEMPPGGTIDLTSLGSAGRLGGASVLAPAVADASVGRTSLADSCTDGEAVPERVLGPSPSELFTRHSPSELPCTGPERGVRSSRQTPGVLISGLTERSAPYDTLPGLDFSWRL